MSENLLGEDQNIIAEMAETIEDLRYALKEEKESHKVDNDRFLHRIVVLKKDHKEEISKLMDSFHAQNIKHILESNLKSMPWLAGMMSDFLTYDLEAEAQKLEWGHSKERERKVATIREIRRSAAERIRQAKLAVYQLEYLKTLVPGIEDLLMTDYNDLEWEGKIPDHDYTRDYMSESEWQALSGEERDQLALDRYVESHKKSQWQIGRDYELSVGHRLMNQGYSVELFGTLMKYDDLGRDVIARKSNETLIIQCKYWAQSKVIHEKHIFQLYGTAIEYSLENAHQGEKVTPVFVTNTVLSDTAKRVAEKLEICVKENVPFIEFPRIKCNLGKDEYGANTRIYHLPMDQQYDTTIIDKPGEFYAYTVSEAVNKGFRRAFRWHGK